ncbi:MAG: HEAT repeat domain-containing protein [Gammaproteobacteria bacterium]
MRTLVAIAIMLLAGLLITLVLYILLRRWLITWFASIERERRAMLERKLAPWFTDPAAPPPPALGKLRRWPDHAIFLDLCLQRLPGASTDIRERIIAWLGRHGHVDRWIKQLRRRDPWQRERAVELLGVLRLPHTTDLLIEALNDPELDVRMRAAAALGALGGTRSRDALLNALTDENRWSAIRISGLLANMGPGTAEALVAALPSMGRGARLAAIDVLARIGGPVTASAIMHLLADDDSDIRARSAAALGQMNYSPAAEQLTAALHDEAWPVRAMAAKALGALQIKAAIPALCDALRDPEWWVRANGAEALRAMGPQGREALAHMANDTDRFARDQARAMLSNEALTC